MSGIATDATVTLIETLDDVLDFRAWLSERRDWLGCDIETTGLNLGRDRVRLCQFGDTQRGWAFSWDDWRGVARDLLPHYRGRIVFHNAAFDLGFLKRDGVNVPQRWVEDTMIMAHLIEPRFAIGLKPVAAKHLGKEAWIGKDALSKAFHGGGWGWETIPIDHPSYYIYSAMDTMLTAALAEVLYPKIKPFERVYEVEMGCLFVLRDARLRGLMIDTDYVERTRSRLIAENAAHAARIPFEPSKDRQVEAYFTRLGVEGGRSPILKDWWPWRTDSGNASFDDDALKWAEPLAPDLVEALRRWRKNQKLINSYLDNMREMNVDGVLRCNIKTVGARTGRMSITEPALQTLPRGRVIRDAFIAREGTKLVLADYEQMEARVFASFADCQPMIDTFMRGDDIHTWTASKVYEKPEDQIEKWTERDVAKHVSYAKLYGAGPAKIALTANTSLGAVEAFLDKYNALFPEVERYSQELIGCVMRQIYETGDGYVTTVLGRRLPVDKDKPYTAMNFKVQSSATADILKLKIIELAEAGLAEYIRLPVHDEIVSEVPDDCVDDALHIINEVMPETRHFTCPLTIDTDVVMRWGAHYEEDPLKRGHWTQFLDDTPSFYSTQDDII